MANAQTFVNLEELDISATQQSYGSAVKNISVVGESLSIAGEKFAKGIGVHAKSTLKIKIEYFDVKEITGIDKQLALEASVNSAMYKPELVASTNNPRKKALMPLYNKYVNEDKYIPADYFLRIAI